MYTCLLGHLWPRGDGPFVLSEKESLRSSKFLNLGHVRHSFEGHSHEHTFADRLGPENAWAPTCTSSHKVIVQYENEVVAMGPMPDP